MYVLLTNMYDPWWECIIPSLPHHFVRSHITPVYGPYRLIVDVQQISTKVDTMALSVRPCCAVVKAFQNLYSRCTYGNGKRLLISPGLVDVPRLTSYRIYILHLVRFARCCTSVFDFHSKNLQITSKLLTQGYRYHNIRKTFGKFYRSYSELLSKFDAISFY